MLLREEREILRQNFAFEFQDSRFKFQDRRKVGANALAFFSFKFQVSCFRRFPKPSSLGPQLSEMDFLDYHRAYRPDHYGKALSASVGRAFFVR